MPKLEQEDIISVVEGIASTERLRQRYKTNIEENLAIIIADDWLEDKESPIAPGGNGYAVIVTQDLLNDTKIVLMQLDENGNYIQLEE